MCLLEAEPPIAIWPHTASFSSPRVSKAKTQAARGVWVCMCLCLDKQVKNVLGGEPFLPRAHLGIFVAPSHLSVPLFCFLPDRSDSSGWFAWVLRDTAFPCLCVCVCVCVGEYDTSQKQCEPCVFMMLNYFVSRSWFGTWFSFLHVARAQQRPPDTLGNYSGF